MKSPVDVGFLVRKPQPRAPSWARVSTLLYHRETHSVRLPPVREYCKSNQRAGLVAAEASQDAFLPSPSTSPGPKSPVFGREGAGRVQPYKQTPAVSTLPRSACVTVFVPSSSVVVVVHMLVDAATVNRSGEWGWMPLLRTRAVLSARGTTFSIGASFVMAGFNSRPVVVVYAVIPI